MWKSRFFLLAGVLAVGIAMASVPESPAGFSDPLDIDNEYGPFVPFRLKHFELTRGDGEVSVIDVYRAETRTFELEDGTEVECACLQEWEIEDGEVLEISWNYFAQDDDGTVWYFGEVVDIFEDGEVLHDGSWLVGGPSGDDPEETLTADAPTVFMPADPELGDVWKPEDLPEDDLEEFVKSKGIVGVVDTPAGSFDDVLRVKEKTPAVEFKWYAPGVGVIRGKEANEILALVDLLDHEDGDALDDALDDLLEELLGDDGEE
jgi:hypothetical protein